MTNLITAQDISDFAPDLDTSMYSATTLSGLIAQATSKIAAFCNVKGFDYTTYTDTDKALINNEGSLIISPRTRPLLTLTSVTLKRGGFSTSLNLTDSTGLPIYQIADPGNRVEIPNSYLYLTGTYLAGGQSQMIALKYADMFCTAVYTAGYSTIPFDLKDACVLFVQDAIMRRLNRAGVQSFSQGSLSMTYGAGGTNSAGDSRIIQQAKNILLEGDYVRPEIF